VSNVRIHNPTICNRNGWGGENEIDSMEGNEIVIFKIEATNTLINKTL